MSGTASASWLAQLESQPWYAGVASTFQTMAPSVPAAVWQGELFVEDSSLDPTAQDYAQSGHYGLFQENADFPTTVGLPAASTQQLQDPSYNAYVAAEAMQQAVQNNGATTVPGIVTALEGAGWPGSPAPAGDLQTRVAAINAIASGQNPPASSSSPATGTAEQSPLDSLQQSVQGWLQGLEQNLLIAGVLLGLMAGGFYLLAASINAQPQVIARP